MTLAIGIDTGGTFTDAVIVDPARGAVLAKAKALTTPGDLQAGIAAALAALDRRRFAEVAVVSLSTTLATNAIAEGKGPPVGLVLAVPDPATFALPAPRPAEEVAVVAGAHDRHGRVAVPLDLDGARAAVERWGARVSAFAVSTYFGIYDAEFERALRRMIGERFAAPVVCGHELSGTAGLLERAATACLNARLLPTIQDLLGAVEATLRALGLRAPLMVVKGDGALMNAAAAMERPVETVLSGPAASAIGACRLAGTGDALVVDIGGTTTDVARVRDGHAGIAADGARVGGWQTRVRAVDMWTEGLGGDSRIALDDDGGLRVGPRRAVPVCCAAAGDPTLRERLAALAGDDAAPPPGATTFFRLHRRPRIALSHYEERLAALLEARVLSRREIDEQVTPFLRLDRLVDAGVLAEVAVTPTDLLHLDGRLALWDAEAARLALALLARQAGCAVAELAARAWDELTRSLTRQLAARALDEVPGRAARGTAATGELLGRLLALPPDGPVTAALRLALPVVGVGAPAGAFLPPVAARLGARLTVPPHAEVANAVGAVFARVVEEATAHVRPEQPHGFRVVTPERHGQFPTLAEALGCAEAWAREAAAAGAVRQGARAPEVSVTREEKRVPVRGGAPVLLECRVTARAVGPAGSP